MYLKTIKRVSTLIYSTIEDSEVVLVVLNIIMQVCRICQVLSGQTSAAVLELELITTSVPSLAELRNFLIVDSYGSSSSLSGCSSIASLINICRYFFLYQMFKSTVSFIQFRCKQLTTIQHNKQELSGM
jgi:hypothetical protein